MSDIWVPKDQSEAEWVMRIEAVRYEKAQMEFEADKTMSKIDHTRFLIAKIEQNLEFLASRKARIILILEYRNAKRNLKILRESEKALLLLLDQQERSHVRLEHEIKTLEEEATKAGKVLRFKKRDEEGEGLPD